MTERSRAEEVLRKRIADLERSLAEERQAYQALKAHADEVYELYNQAPCGYHSLDKDGVVVAINDTELSWLGYTREETVGHKRISDLLTPESMRMFRENFPGFKERGWVRDLPFHLRRKDGTTIPVLISAVAVKDAEGNYVMSRSTVYDITERRQQEEALRRAEVQEQLIAAQAAALAELSSPLLAISDRAVLMPLVGAVDAQRAGRMLEVLLDGIVARGASVAILDITGVRGTGQEMANALVQAAQAARLLGAEVVLSGMQPCVAQELLSLGADLRGIHSCNNLQGAIAHAMKRK